MTVEYTQDEYCGFLLTTAGCNCWAGTDALEYALGFPGWLHPYDDVFRWSEQQLREAWSITTMTHVNVASPTVCTDTNQWRCHNCSFGTRAVEKPTRYRKRTGTIQTEGSVIASWRSIAYMPLLEKCAILSSSEFISLLRRFGPYSGHGLPSFHPSILSIFCHRLPVPYMENGDCILLYVVLPPAAWCSY